MSPSLPKTYKAAVIEKANAPLVIKELPLKSPGPKQVLVKVLACGVCHSDSGAQGGHFGNPFPLVPGHEIIGDVVALGEGVSRVTLGDRAGGPWHGGHDNACNQCARGMFQTCDNAQINGVTRDGGYAEYVLLREEAVVRLPKDTDPAAAAPLLCAGVTVFNGLRKLRVEQGGLVAVQGIGGLGHLAIQYASKMGYRVVAISSGASKRDFAHQLGAHAYIDSSACDAAAELRKMGGGGAAAIVATAPNPAAIGPMVAGLRVGGKLLVVAAAGPITVDSNTMLMRAASVVGWPSGHALDAEEAVQFAADHGIRCMVEKFTLEDANRAMEHCTSGKVRFRGVLVL
ncbi:zinc-binding dehydrogenase [Apiospora kogelbergensis]|uniref:Zinc-binding dehydrogenase n=1 Tax=Apiospora kogelbergensis TaxID=1337665 RepID=A0AAW0QF66_9PEZI